MKIQFLEIETEQSWAVTAVAPGYLGSFIKLDGHAAVLSRIGPTQNADEIIDQIKETAPDILGLSLTTQQWRRAAHLLSLIRKKIEVPVIVGGLHSTFAPQAVLMADGIDYVCLGEGEQALNDFLTCFEKQNEIRAGQIQNIWVKGADRPSIRPPVESLDNLPFMDRSLIGEPDGIVHLNTQRGCPFTCTFCASGAIGRLYGGRKYIRRRSADNVLEELHHIRSIQPLNYVIFLDDTFTLNACWVRDFCRRYGKDFGIGFSINARVETVDPGMINSLSAAGCKHIIYGVESGSRRIRRDVLNRHTGNHRFKNAFRWTKEAGILATANYMIGLPYETREDIEQTLALDRELEPDDFGCFVFYPFPGTHLHHLCLQNGLLPENYMDLKVSHRRSILNLPNLTCDDITYYYEFFESIRKDRYRKRYGGELNGEAKSPPSVSHAHIAVG